MQGHLPCVPAKGCHRLAQGMACLFTRTGIPPWRALPHGHASFRGECTVLESPLWNHMRPTVDPDAFQEMGEQVCHPPKRMCGYGRYIWGLLEELTGTGKCFPETKPQASL
ncbi:MAG: hypothetical protein OXD45_11530 [Rhodobacteraceae bacterium]|nr:hypothetical protein [Paracoccaceae bacterium]